MQSPCNINLKNNRHFLGFYEIVNFVWQNIFYKLQTLNYKSSSCSFLSVNFVILLDCQFLSMFFGQIVWIPIGLLVSLVKHSTFLLFIYLYRIVTLSTRYREISHRVVHNIELENNYKWLGVSLGNRTLLFYVKKVDVESSRQHICRLLELV